ncbi:MAG: zinc dependent phospholipase C family protein [Clostridia bacterium]
MNYTGHLAFGINALKFLKQNKIVSNENIFLTGCLAPDIARTDKKPKAVTHFRDKSPNFYTVPDLNRFISKYADRLDEDFVLGYLCHLYADKVFSNIFLPKTAPTLDVNLEPTLLFSDSVYIKNMKDCSIYKVTDYTSDTGLYADYSKLSDDVGKFFNVPFTYEYSTEDPNMEEIDSSKLLKIQEECIKYYNESTSTFYENNEDTQFIDKCKYINFIDKYSTYFASSLKENNLDKLTS